MSNNHEAPEERREKLRQGELKNPASSVKGSNLSDLVGGTSWKTAGIIILLLILSLVLYAVLSR